MGFSARSLLISMSGRGPVWALWVAPRLVAWTVLACARLWMAGGILSSLGVLFGFPFFFLFFLLLAFSPVHISLGNIRRALGR